MSQHRHSGSSRGSGSSKVWHMEVDEESTLSQTQTLTQAQRSLEQHSPSEVEQKVNELVQFLLIKDQKKIPIKRIDILKYVLKDYKDLFPEILRRANQTLQQVFGLGVVEIDPKYHSYILISKFPPLEADTVNDDENTPKMGLLIVILSVIFMKGNVIKESAVWEMLRRLHIDCSGGKHRVFGDVKKLVTEEFIQRQNPKTWMSQYNEAEAEAGAVGKL
ncbi:putative Melanoma-associated antigen D2-like protein [Naja naja]|nr:putative Melanoma-associated antigen D2-like protein [Naja naja]